MSPGPKARVSAFQDAVLLRERGELRAELANLSNGLANLLSRHARGAASPCWMLTLDARRASRISAILRRLAALQEKRWRLSQAANP